MDVPPLYASDNMRNLITINGECMTLTDYKLREAIRVAHIHGLNAKDIVPKRRNGLIVGYYVINEGGETAVATIE